MRVGELVIIITSKTKMKLIMFTYLTIWKRKSRPEMVNIYFENG